MNKAIIQKSKTTQFEILSCCACTAFASAYMVYSNLWEIRVTDIRTDTQIQTLIDNCMPDKHMHTVPRHKYRNNIMYAYCIIRLPYWKMIKSQFVLDTRQLKAMLFTIIRGWFGHDFTFPIPTVIKKTTCCKVQILDLIQQECHVWVQCIETWKFHG